MGILGLEWPPARQQSDPMSFVGRRSWSGPVGRRDRPNSASGRELPQISALSGGDAPRRAGRYAEVTRHVGAKWVVHMVVI